MFTIKYRQFQPCGAQPVGGPTHYDITEGIHGPFEFVSQEMDGGYVVVHAHREGGAPGMTYGPIGGRDLVAGQEPLPAPTLWVMNEAGATVAKYDF